MAIVIAGGTGFLGRPLADALVKDGHEVVILTRRASGLSAPPGQRFVEWNPYGSAGPWSTALERAEAVVNLAGESIAARRWSNTQKQSIHDSRVLATRSLVSAIEQVSVPPAVFVSGSAVGYYGRLGDEIVREDHAPGTDFLARVAVDWEAEARRAEPRTRVVIVRTGLPIERDGGALGKMLLPFRLGVGGPLGSGRQYWPWIHRQDWIDLVRFAIRERAAAGPLNATAPQPVTNAEFTRALGRALKRPAFMPAPAFALNIVLGEMAEALLLSGQRAVPAQAERLGYRFAFTQLDAALQSIFR